jgi:esterase/lipase superfamily enzyme
MAGSSTEAAAELFAFALTCVHVVTEAGTPPTEPGQQVTWTHLSPFAKDGHVWPLTGVTFDGETYSATLTKPSEFLKALQESAAGQRKHVVIYVHGFDDAPIEVLRKGREIEQGLNTRAPSPAESPKALLIPFIWPCSQTNWPPGPLKLKNRYHQDQANSHAYAGCLARIFNWATEVTMPSCLLEVSVICHSMGNLVFTRAVKKLRKMRQNVPLLFNLLAMVAADVDAQVFTKDPFVCSIAHRSQIYFNPRDVALKKSATVNGARRLGAEGPAPPVDAALGLELFNCSGQSAGGLLGHSYQSDALVLDRVAAQLWPA